jgi:hypothetical protein
VVVGAGIVGSSIAYLAWIGGCGGDGPDGARDLRGSVVFATPGSTCGN